MGFDKKAPSGRPGPRGPRTEAGGRPPSRNDRNDRGDRGRTSDRKPDGDEIMVVCGIHPVEEFLRIRPKMVRYILLDRRTPPGAIEAARLAQTLGIEVRDADPDQFNDLAGNANAQGIIAVLKPLTPVNGDDLVEAVAAAGEGLLVALDSVQDPQNLGSIMRTAAFFGAAGIILPKDRSVRITSTAVRASAGGAARVPIGEVVNLARTLQKCFDLGMTVTGAVVSGGEPLENMPKEGPRVVVLGSEGAGMRRLVSESCSMLVTIPSPGGFESLNVGVAAGILLCAASGRPVPTPKPVRPQHPEFEGVLSDE